MSSNSALIDEVIAKILSGNRDTTAAHLREVLIDMIGSYQNLDGKNAADGFLGLDNDGNAFFGSNFIVLSTEAASKILFLDVDKKIRSSGVSSNILSFLETIRSDIQSQVDQSSWKNVCRVATTGNIDLVGAPSLVDGVTLNDGDRVLVESQTDRHENGIYVFTGGTLTRAYDFSRDNDTHARATIQISEGVVNAGTTWVCTNTDPIAFGSEDIAFELQQYLFSDLNSGLIFVGSSANKAARVVLSLNATPGTFNLSNAGVLTLPNSTTALRGLLSSSDWNTFNSKAPLASPTFTGTPAAPTASGGTNTTQIATTAFVTAAIVSTPPALTQYRIGFGDASNVMTSAPSFFAIDGGTGTSSMYVQNGSSTADRVIISSQAGLNNIEAPRNMLISCSQGYIKLVTDNTATIMASHSSRPVGWKLDSNGFRIRDSLIAEVDNANNYLTVDRNSFFGGNIDATAFVDINSGTTANASLRMRSGVAPTAPNNGDIFNDGSNIVVPANGLTAVNFFTTSATPSISAGTGAGTSPTVSIVGNNLGGKITIIAGTLPTLGGDIATITFSGSFAFPNGCAVTITAGNATALGNILSTYVVGGTTTFVLKNSTTALTAGTTILNYTVSGY